MAISIALIILLGLSADALFRRFQLPGLVGMLIVGVLVGPYVFSLVSPEMMNISGDFRKIALIVILLRAGFELRRDTLNRVGRAAIIMSTVPAVCLKYWHESSGKAPGTGKTISHYYTRGDTSFQEEWEILYDW